MGSKDRSYQVVTLVALVVAVLGLSVGFAAFTNTLTIKSSAEVKPDPNQFNVDLSGATDTEVTTVTASTVSTGATAETASINNAGATTNVIQNLKATFTEPGQSVTYEFYARNVGKYTAYLNDIAFNAATGATANETKVCTPGASTTASQVTAACENISLTLSVGSLTGVTGSQSGISSHSLAVDANEKITLTIAYTGSAIADGDWSVAFGDIVLTYDSVD